MADFLAFVWLMLVLVIGFGIDNYIYSLNRKEQ